MSPRPRAPAAVHPRVQPRVQMQKAVYARFEQGPCQILKLLDVSETGARVSGGALEKMPTRLQLEWSIVPGLRAEVLNCQVIWQRGGITGLRFRDLEPRMQAVLHGLIRFHRG